MEKLKVRVDLEDITDRLDGPLADLHLRLLPVITKWGEKDYHGFDISTRCGYDYTEVILTGLRDETDEELQKRLAKAAKVKEQKLKNKEAKRKLYLALKKEFE